jgi:hypothetical protein
LLKGRNLISRHGMSKIINELIGGLGRNLIYSLRKTQTKTDKQKYRAEKFFH